MGFMLAMSGVTAACGKSGDGAVGKAATVAAPAPTAAAATAAATATTGAAKERPLPPGRSAPPTLDEWKNQTKEVTVKGSTAQKCETKIVREYLRIACKGAVDYEGEPTSIKLVKSGGGVLTFGGSGVTTLILPFVEGTDFEAVFSWKAKSHKLVVQWPKGSKQPVIVGTFEGAASPLDPAPKGDDEKLCACQKKVTGGASCEDLYGGANADCDRTYGGDCVKLLACSRGDREFEPQCAPGTYVFEGNLCLKPCGEGQPPCAGNCYIYADGVGFCMPKN